jgi:hypothetical protein
MQKFYFEELARSGSSTTSPPHHLTCTLARGPEPRPLRTVGIRPHGFGSTLAQTDHYCHERDLP